MATYCYINEDGSQFEMTFPVGQAPATIGSAQRNYFAEHKSVPPTKGWPLTCVSSGVNAADAGKLRQYLADAGVPTEVTPDGDPVYKNARHRKRALKARGMFDRLAYC